MVVALFAVLRTGAAYLPLERDYPLARLTGMLDDARPVLLVCHGASADWPRTSARLGADVLALDDPAVIDALAAHLGGAAVRRRTRRRSPKPAAQRLDHPAYVIFTSGSTGRPKGVVTPYRGLTNMQLNHRAEIFDPAVAKAGGRRLRVAHTVSFSFDMSWEELLWLVEGHEVHICDEELRRDATALVAYCRTTPHRRRQRDTQLRPPPVRAGPARTPGGHTPDAGAARRRSRLRRGLAPAARHPRRHRLQPVRPHRVHHQHPRRAAPTTAPPRLSDTRSGTPAPTSWTRGCARSATVSSASCTSRARVWRAATCDRPGLTADRFVADPFTRRRPDVPHRRPGGPPARRGRHPRLLRPQRRPGQDPRLPGGTRRGRPRRCPALPGVRQAVAIARPGPSTVGQAARRLRRARDRLGRDADPPRSPPSCGPRSPDALPDYMVPALYGVRRRAPADGQRQARHRAPCPSPSPRRRARRATRATTGKRCWRTSSARSSGLPHVGIDDDFFTLGGDSISSIAVSGRARKAGSAHHPARRLPAPHRRRPGRGHRDRRAAAAPAEPDSGVGAIAPTPMLAETAQAETPLANFYQSMVLATPAGITGDQLELVLAAVLDAHDMLRARLDVGDDGWTLSVPDRRRRAASVLTTAHGCARRRRRRRGDRRRGRRTGPRRRA